MSLITAKGKEVKEQVNKSKVDLKEAYFRLKNENESVTVRVLSTTDYVSYKAHGDYGKGIYNTPCLAVGGQDCPFCKAKDSNIDGWDTFYAKDRFIFAFGELNSGKVKVLEVSKNQAKKLIADIDEYAEEIQDGEIAFNLTRTGTGTSTAYSLKPLTTKKFKGVQTQFQVFDGQVVELEFYEERIVPKTLDYMVKLLHEAGFPVADHFDAELVAKATEDAEVKEVEGTEEDVI
jgi:hypothetical protein